MIISASYKTDIPAFYGDWMINRLEAGYCRMVNPYGGQIYTIPLDRQSVDGFVFWTRNIGPFIDKLDKVGEMGFPFTIQYTISGYPRPLDQATIEARYAVEHIRRLGGKLGGRAIVWRYDPITFTSLSPPAWHLKNFAGLARSLAGSVNEVVVSFAHIYRKTERNMKAAARAFDFEWFDPDPGEKRALLEKLAAIAADNGLVLSLCGQPEFLIDGVREAVCIDAGRLGDVAGYPIKASAKSHRDRCGCHASRDIGDYDTCPQGCVYCYAVTGRERAKHRFSQHDASSDFLFYDERRR